MYRNSRATAPDTEYLLFTYHHGPIIAPIDDPQPDPARLGQGAMAVFTVRNGELHCKDKILAFVSSPDPQHLLYFIPSNDVTSFLNTKVQFDWEGGKCVMKIAGMFLLLLCKWKDY